ncbi:MAG: DUF6412 domain-containing protein [Actinomycetota bacterium]|nr:DUF6412 domain-containing protein [Actinomycetota bacterium]
MVPGGAVLRLRFVLAMLPTLAVALLAVGLALPGGSPGSLAITTAMAAALAVVVAVSAGTFRLGSAAGPARIRAVSLRECAKRSVFLRLRDPAARGRTRSRAPSPA